MKSVSKAFFLLGAMFFAGSIAAQQIDEPGGMPLPGGCPDTCCMTNNSQCVTSPAPCVASCNAYKCARGGGVSQCNK
jgi:hypothetical protein